MRYMLTFPLLGTFYWTDDLTVAETIVASHFGLSAEIREGGRTVRCFTEKDLAKAEAARIALPAMREAYKRHDLTFHNS